MIDPDIGGRIRHAREQRGLSLQDAAMRTKLSLQMLRAIERNEFTSLPPGIYRKAYLRTLAAEVGLSPNEIASDYEALHEPVVVPASTSKEEAARDKWIEQLTPSSRGNLVTLAVFTALTVVWFRMQTDPVPERVRFDTRADEPLAARAFLNGNMIFTIPGERSVGARVAASRELADAPLRIEIAATDWCWVAADSDGERVLYRLVEPGERVVLEGWHKISLRLGDAGAVSLSINDGPSRTPGASGQVVELDVTPDDLERMRAADVETGAVG
jgi:transcriptional regulator with XRE-family HTH domain